MLLRRASLCETFSPDGAPYSKYCTCNIWQVTSARRRMDDTWVVFVQYVCSRGQTVFSIVNHLRSRVALSRPDLIGQDRSFFVSLVVTKGKHETRKCRLSPTLDHEGAQVSAPSHRARLWRLHLHKSSRDARGLLFSEQLLPQVLSRCVASEQSMVYWSDVRRKSSRGVVYLSYWYVNFSHPFLIQTTTKHYLRDNIDPTRIIPVQSDQALSLQQSH